jgi:peptidoglycan/xylan/chitin deacetylase (PgdA/CDA1 family)
MALVSRSFDVVGIDDLIAFRRGARLPKNPLLVTFDDGYRDNYEAALPVLKKHGVRAVFFIATHYMTERRLFWWDRINYVLKRSPRDAVTLSYPEPATLPLTGHERARARAIRRALRVVKDHHALDLERFLTELAEAAGVSLSREDERAIVDRLLMTWDEVRALRAAGMDVQSHTSTHRVLQTLPDDALDRELRGSREVLEAELREPVRAVSYPVGKPLRLTPHIRTAVRRAGYELGFSNGTGINHAWDTDPLDIRRISLDAGLSFAFFRTMLALPYLAY